MLTWMPAVLRKLLVQRRRARRAGGSHLIYRLKAWPSLPEAGRTAEIYRMLSVMSSQPVSRRWLVERGGIAPRRLDRLLAQLVRDGAVEVIDPASFAAEGALEVIDPSGFSPSHSAA